MQQLLLCLEFTSFLVILWEDLLVEKDLQPKLFEQDASL